MPQTCKNHPSETAIRDEWQDAHYCPVCHEWIEEQDRTDKAEVKAKQRKVVVGGKR